MGNIITVKNTEDFHDTTAEIIVQNNIDYIPKVSVIIPVYNTEKYLRECLDSVVNQTLREIEIICVDDGSIDSSLEILKEYAAKDNRITILKQENFGGGVSRNTGLSVAKGEYLAFLDSDDFYDNTYLDIMLDRIIKDGSELAVCNVNLYDNITKQVTECSYVMQEKFMPKNTLCTYKDITQNRFMIFQNWNWNKIFNHQFIKKNKILFQSLYRTNDLYFTFVSLILANKISIIRERLVYYRKNISTNSQSTNDLYPTDWLKAFTAVKRFLDNQNLFSDLKQDYLEFFFKTYNYNINALKDVKSYELVKHYINDNRKGLGLNLKLRKDTKVKPAIQKFYKFINSSDIRLKYKNKNSKNTENTIPIVLATDNNYAIYTYISLLSLLKNKKNTTKYRIVMLCNSNLSYYYKYSFYKLVQENDCIYETYTIGGIFDSMEMRLSHITNTTYYRLLLPNLLRNVDKIIWLDGDTIVNNDLSGLYNYDMENYYLAGVIAPYVESHPDYYKEINISSMSQYVNAGMLLWNLKKMREDSLVEDFINNLDKNYYLQDQDILNKVCYNFIRLLPLKYNFMTILEGRKESFISKSIFSNEEYIEAENFPVIIHYCSKQKPWNSKDILLAKDWWRYAKLSPYYNELIKAYKSYNNKYNYTFIERIFSIINQSSKKGKWYKVICILGFKFSFRNKKKEKELAEKKEKEKILKNIKKFKKQNKEIKEQLEVFQEQNEKLKNEIVKQKNEENKLIESKVDWLKKDYRNKLNDLAKKQQYKLHKYCSPEMRPVALKDWYFEHTGEELNLDNPQTFNEKIQWMKLYDSTPIKTRLADKYLVREWVKEKIGEEYLIPLLGVWDKFDDIDFNQLPDQFVLKCNHGSGYNIIVTDKSKLDLEDIRKKINNWMSEDYAYKGGFEMHYSAIPRKIIAEKYISELGDNGIFDYRFFCFNGKCEQIWLDIGSGTPQHRRKIYDKNWNEQDIIVKWPRLEQKIEKPKELEQLIYFSETLSKGFALVRVDFYIENSKIYFGEMTFTSMSGTGKFQPESEDLRLGNLIHLPNEIKIKENV